MQTFIILLQIIIPLFFLWLCIKRIEFALYLLTAEIVLGGAGGRWLEYPGGLSIRIIFLILFFAVWFLKLVFGKIKFEIKNKKIFYAVLILALGYPLFFGLVMYFIYAKNIFYLINDANGWAFYLLFLPMANIIDNRQKLFRLIKVYLLSILIMGAAIVLIYFASALHLLNIWQVQNFLLEKGLQMGGKVGLMPDGALRVFLGSSIFLPFGIFAALGLRKKKLEKKTSHNKIFTAVQIFAILICYFALIASYTRGLWIGSILGLVFFLFWVNWRRRLKIILGLFILVFLTQIIFQQVFQVSFINTFLGRITSSVSVVKDPVSVGARVSQIKILAIKILEHPFLGTGFGTTIAGYRQNVAAPFSFELGYLDMIVKFGFIGFIFWVLFIVYLIFLALRALWFNFQINKKEKLLIISSLASVLVLLFVSGTSPFITSGFGILQILVLMLVIEKLAYKN